MPTSLESIIGDVAKHYWGDPDRSSQKELRFGTHGSKCVNLADGTWYDFENNVGGGVVDLIKSEEPNVRVGDILEQFGLPKNTEYNDISIFQKPVEKSLVDTYVYEDADNNIIFGVDRIEWNEGGKQKKQFKQFQIKNGQRIDNLDGIENRNTPFHLPELLSKPSKPVFVVEGEKCVMALEQHGLIATTNAGGSGSWKDSHSDYLKGRSVYILPDNDPPGEKHGRQVAATLIGKAERIKLVNLPGLDNGGDVFDFLADQGIGALMDIVRKAPLLDKPPLPIRVLSLADVLNLEPVPWLIEDLIPEGSMAMVYGAPGAGKSFLALDIALSVAHGVAWQNHSARQGVVIYVAGEGVGGLRKRIRAWHTHHSKIAEAPLFIIPVAVGLLEEDAMADLEATIEGVANGADVKMVIFDTLARCMAADENSAQDMGEAVNAMDRIRHKFNCAVVIIHHAGKDATRGARGSTALTGAVDVSIRLTRSDKLISMVVEKQKDAEAIEAKWLRGEVIEWQDNALAGNENSLVLLPADNNEAPKEIRLSAAQKVTLDALQIAVEKHGKFPGGSVPGKAVDEDAWRTICYGMTISNGGPEGRKKAFQRSANELLKRKIIIKKEGFVWMNDYT
jgi:KaiC/GvpD/RAD55 family RecA-like ATPase